MITLNREDVAADGNALYRIITWHELGRLLVEYDFFFVLHENGNATFRKTSDESAYTCLSDEQYELLYGHKPSIYTSETRKECLMQIRNLSRAERVRELTK